MPALYLHVFWASHDKKYPNKHRTFHYELSLLCFKCCFLQDEGVTVPLLLSDMLLRIKTKQCYKQIYTHRNCTHAGPFLQALRFQWLYKLQKTLQLCHHLNRQEHKNDPEVPQKGEHKTRKTGQRIGSFMYKTILNVQSYT